MFEARRRSSRCTRGGGKKFFDVAEVSLLHVLFDGVEAFLGGDFHLGVAPAGDFNHHVEMFALSAREIR